MPRVFGYLQCPFVSESKGDGQKNTTSSNLERPYLDEKKSCYYSSYMAVVENLMEDTMMYSLYHRVVEILKYIQISINGTLDLIGDKII